MSVYFDKTLNQPDINCDAGGREGGIVACPEITTVYYYFTLYTRAESLTQTETDTIHDVHIMMTTRMFHDDNE